MKGYGIVFCLGLHLQFGYFELSLGQVTLNLKGNTQLATNFGIKMAGNVELFSGYEVMLATYEARERREEFVVTKKKSMAMTEKMAADLAKMLRKKQRAVKRLVDVLENESETFDWDSDSVEVPYNNVEFLNKDEQDLIDDDKTEYEVQRRYLNLVKDAKFSNRPINLNESVVQVPFDVYSKGIDVVRGVSWSKALDEKFRANAKQDPTLKWQYFGSTEGFLRVYPGYQWKMETQFERPNIYDCRNRNWYTEAATYPKDMIILVDGSGSMMGLKMSIAAHVVKTLLETLGDNDFFNVLTYSDEVRYVESCFEGTLVRADSGNKARMLESLRHSNTSNVADLSKALNESFNLLLNFHSSGSGSDCYSSIMIITDGATDSYQEVMDTYMNMTKRQIRIFSYLIGADKAYLKPVRDIACNNHGYFHQVESRNDVSEKVLKYLTVMNRPQAIKGDHHTIWTKPYYDTTYLDRGFGMVSTVATPVYLHSFWKKPKMLGVAATDVPVSLMLDSITIHRAGVNSYVFLITNNGYVVAHPRLKTFYTTKHYEIKVKPNYNSIDIDDLEGSAVNETIRNHLLARLKGSTDEKPVVVPMDNWTRASQITGTYYYAPVANTPFSLGMFVPIGYGELTIDYPRSLKAKRSGPTYSELECDQVNGHLMDNYRSREMPSKNSAICSLNSSDVTVSEQWKYCITKDGSVMISSNGQEMTQLDMIKLFFSEKDENIDCDTELLTNVLFDVLSTSAMTPIWKEHSDYRNTTSEGIVLAFIMTKSGISRKYWHRDSSLGYDDLKETLNGFDRQTFPSFYRRAAAYPERDVWIYSFINSEPKKRPRLLLVTQALRRSGFVHGVIGVILESRRFTEKFWTEVPSSTGSDCSQNPESKFSCYVIDENGVVVLSSLDPVNDVGKQIGLLDGQVTRHLLENNVFAITNLYDHGTICQVTEPSESLGGSAVSSYLTNPFRSVASYATFWTKEVSLLLAKLVVWNLWNLIFNSATTEATFSTFVENKDHYKVCDMKYELLAVNNNAMPYNNVTYCADDCQRQIGIQRINQSNLYLLVVEKGLRCDCSNQTYTFKLKKEDIYYPGGEICQRLRTHKLGRKVDGCDVHHKNKRLGDFSSLECERSAGSSLHRTRWTKFEKRKNKQPSTISYSYLTLSISWFIPYILFSILNLSDSIHLSPFV
ncbi:voltage-dependent calcium channel subunit alpha-2/delta-3-like [Styela clava]